MKDWQFNILFCLAVLGAVVMLFGEEFGIVVRPEVAGLFGVIMAFILQQKESQKKDGEQSPEQDAEIEPTKITRRTTTKKEK